MKKISINRATGIFAFLLIAGWMITQSSCTQTMANTQNLTRYLDESMPSFTLADYYGKEFSSESYRGKYLVIHIATTWCPYCNAEAPSLEKLYQEYKDKGVEVLIIDVKEDKELVKKSLIDRFNLSFPVLLDDDGTVAASFAPEDVLPELARDEVMLASNLLVDPEGKIKFFSLLDTYNFDSKLEELRSVLDENL